MKSAHPIFEILKFYIIKKHNCRVTKPLAHVMYAKLFSLVFICVDSMAMLILFDLITSVD